MKHFLILSLPIFVFFSSCFAFATEQMVSIPMTETNGNVRLLQTRICFPETALRARAVILNHGSPASAADRPGVTGYKCESEAAQWFLARGFLVVSPIRRGYGSTGGAWSETYGSCDRPDFFKAGLETARDIDAVVDYVTRLPQALENQVVVVGQSAGGWGTIAYDSLPHPKVAALINMAGGRGGHRNGQNNQNCGPEVLAEAAGEYGKTASTPMLWMYAENDSYFAPSLAKALFDAFIASGGRAEFIRAPQFGSDGHLEFGGAGGFKVWGPVFERYLGISEVR